VDDGKVVGYEIYRDQELLTLSDGRSYFDNTLSAGSMYEYAIVAVDDEGNKGESSSLLLNTRD